MNISGARFLTLGLGMAALAFTGTGAVSLAIDSPPTDPNMQVRVEGDRLTVKLKDASLKAVLAEIGRQGRIKVTIHGPLVKTISLEFRQLPLEEGLQRLLRDCGWIAVGHRDGRLEQLVVADNPDAGRRMAPVETALGQRSPALTSDGGTKGSGLLPAERTRAVAAIMEKPALKTFFDVSAHVPDQAPKLEALRDVVDSLSLEEVGDVIGMLRHTSVPRAGWEEALAPLAEVVNAEEWAAIAGSLQDRAVRKEVLKSFEQIQLFKLAQAREALARSKK